MKMEAILLFAAQQIAAYGIKRGLDKIFTNKEEFSTQLYKTINRTIDEYSKKHPVNDIGGKFAFYKSQILIEEFLKYRLFSKDGYKINEEKVQNALERNPNIIKPTEEEIGLFFEIFDRNIKADEKLKTLEIEEFLFDVSVMFTS